MTRNDRAFENASPSGGQQLPVSSALARPGLCRRLAPEDVRPGQFVAVLVQHQGYWRYDCAEDRMVRERMTDLPGTGAEADEQSGGRAGAPLRVLAVSLPFVVVRVMGVPAPTEDSPGGGESGSRPVRTLDLRQAELAEVGREYAWAFTVASRPAPSERGPPGEADHSVDRPGRARRFRKARRRE